MNQIQQAAEGEWSAIHDLIDSNSDEEQSDQRYFYNIWEEDQSIGMQPMWKCMCAIFLQHGR